MKRRQFLSALGVAALPSVVRAQPTGKVRRIVLIHPSNPPTRLFPVLVNELRRLGYIEGQNLLIERYSAEGRTERFPDLAREAVLSKPDIIFSQSARLLLALKAATSSIPIVGVTSDPVAFGIVTSLARPGGNITGVVGDGGPEFWEKHVEIVRAALPTVSKVAYLSPRALWDGVTGATTREAAARLGMTMLPQPLDDPIDETAYRRAFASMVEQRAETLLVGDAPENFTNQDLIIASAEHAKLPAVYPDASFVRRGGFLSHGIDYDELFRYASKEIDQVFRGAAPGDLPFYRTTKILLAINLKSAKKLGVSVPFTLVATADEVIE
jgi:putative ABC transport system substrate-binding protein